jgi:hypothetical protein
MLNSETLEVAIGMAFLFLSVALVCTAIREGLEGLLKWRAMDLERGVRTLLADPDGQTTAELMRHPMLDALFAGHYDPRQLRRSWFAPGKDSQHMRLSKRRNLPSYIPAAQFAVALLDWVARGPLPSRTPAPADAKGTGTSTSDAVVVASRDTLHPGPLTVDVLRQSALAIESAEVQRAVLSALDHCNGDLAQARRNIEVWFNGTMDRASGWYKRRTQAVLFLLGLAVAVAMNIDAFHVMHRLTTDKAFRETVVKEASVAPAPSAAQTPADAASAAQVVRIINAEQALERAALPIGWRQARVATIAASAPHGAAAAAAFTTWPVPRQLCSNAPGDPCAREAWLGADWLDVLAGWLATAFAVMLGAPFWFDVLSRIMIIRSTVKPHEKSPEEASQDRQSTFPAASPAASPPASPVAAPLAAPAPPALANDG